MTFKRRDSRRGASLIEFTLAGIPVIFILISVFEISRGMWMFQTLAHGVKEGVRFAIVHGENCGLSPNNCEATVAQVAAVIRDATPGLQPDEMDVTLATLCSSTPGVSCAADITGKLSALLSNTTTWPDGTQGSPQTNLEITAIIPFRSAIAMFWPGAGGGKQFGVHNLSATSQEEVQF